MKFYNNALKLAVIMLSALLASCATIATNPDIIGTGESTRNYGSYTCVRLGDTLRYEESEYQRLYSAQLNQHKQDKAFSTAAKAAGITLGVMTWFAGGIGGLWGLLDLAVQGDDPVQVRQLMNTSAEVAAIKQAIDAKGCTL